MTRLLSILLLLTCGSAFGQNVTNLVAGQKLWAGMQLTTVYDLGCSDCTNIVVNPGFDTGTFSPWTSTGGAGIIGYLYRSEGYCCDLYSPSGWAQSCQQTLTTVSNQAYTVSVWAADDGTAMHFQVLWNGATNIDAGTGGDGGSRNYTGTATATNSTMELKIRAHGSSYFIVDDVSVIHQ